VRERQSPLVIRRQAIQLSNERLSSVGFEVENAPPGFRADLKIRRRRASFLVKVLAAAAPHHRGGTGSLGLHWMLNETAADDIALVDLSRSKVWLLPSGDFRSKAQPLTGSRYHLDWIVVPLGKAPTKVPGEEEFTCYLLEDQRGS
jgi:hypothetical protein